MNDTANNLILDGLSIEQVGKIPKWLLENYEKNKINFDNAVIGAIAATEKHARMNEHHIVSGLLTNDELNNLSAATLKALKRRFAELRKT